MDSPVGLLRAKRAVTRRDFIRQIGAGLLAGLVLPLSPRGLWTWGSAPASASMDWRQAAFAGLVGQDFRLDLGTRGKLALKLVQVQAGIAKIQAGRTRLVGATVGECFTLSFAGPQKQPLPQGTYAFEQAKLG